MEQDVINLYIGGNTISSIAKKYSSTDFKITSLLKKSGVYKAKEKRRIADHKERIIELREQGKTLDEIADDIGFHKTKVSKYIIEYCGKLHDYQYDGYFKNIDTAAKSYALGLIFSDGFVSKDRNRFGLTMTDKECIDFFKSELKIKNKTIVRDEVLGENPRKTIYDISSSSYEAKQDLINNGCCEDKTNNTKFPNHISKEMLRHFILGFYDGDGGMTIVPNMNHGEWYIVGLKDFILDLNIFLESELNIKFTPHFARKFKYNDNELWVLSLYRTKNIIKTLDYLYQDAPHFMIRKHNLYLQLKAGLRK